MTMQETKQNGNGSNGNGSQAMVKGPAARLATLKDYLEQSRGALAAVVPKHLTPDRLMKIVTTAASRTPTLLECTPESIVRSLIDCGTLGLEPTTPLGLAYMVPYNNNKTGKTECQLIVGYKGLIQLAHQSGEVESVYAHEICENDEWEVELGTNKRLVHKPGFTHRGDPIAFYAVVKFKHGGSDFAFMSKAEVDAIREKSAGRNGDGWTNFYVEMAKKTVIRRLAKTLPLSPEKQLARAVDIEDRNETGYRAGDYGLVIDVPGPGPETDEFAHVGQNVEAQKSRADGLAEKLGKGAA